MNDAPPRSIARHARIEPIRALLTSQSVPAPVTGPGERLVEVRRQRDPAADELNSGRETGLPSPAITCRWCLAATGPEATAGDPATLVSPGRF